jgi:hypothetical protein
MARGGVLAGGEVSAVVYAAEEPLQLSERVWMFPSFWRELHFDYGVVDGFERPPDPPALLDEPKHITSPSKLRLMPPAVFTQVVRVAALALSPRGR